MTRRPTPATVTTTICAATVRGHLDTSAGTPTETSRHHGLSGQDGVTALQRYARTRDCGYVLLDRDADPIEDLPTWDW